MSDYVSEDTMIQMTTTYRRHTKTDKVKRAFNFVMKGMMMSSVMVSSFLQIGGGVAQAASLDNLDADKDFNPDADIKTAQVEVVKDAYQDESAMILNLKNANRMLEAAVKTKQLDTWMFERVMQALVVIEARIEVDGTFEKHQDLLDVILKTEDTLEASDLQNLSLESVTMKTSADKALTNIKTFLEAIGGQSEVSTTTETKPKEVELAYVEEDSDAVLEKGYEVFSSPDWNTGDYSPRNYSDPELKALKEEKATQQVAKTQVNQKLSANQYKDYDSNAYWAKDMKWAIDQGLITGYQNQKHPSQPAKGVGNWIDPSGNLTEYQMLNVMLRYKDGANFESAKTTMKDKTASNFAYVEYHFAKEHGIMTKGSTTNATPAKQQVTRGQMAQALVSMHYGKKVTLQQAVDFMYANKLSTGVNASKGQTLENFGANTKLSRAHIVAFMGRYNDVVKSGSVKDTLNTGTSVGGIETPTPPVVNSGSNPAPPSFEHTKYDYSNLRGEFSTAKGFTQNGIKVSYKNHTYNTKSQAEYDQVMNYVNNRIKGKTLNDVKSELSNLEFDLQVLERLMNGELTVITDRTNPASRTEENTTAYRYNIAYKDVIKQGVKFETLAKFSAASDYVESFTGGASTAWGPPESAYDFFIKGEIDCTSSSYATQALFDALGYNTAVVHSPRANHDYVIIELDGTWFKLVGMKVFDKSSVGNGDYIKFAPTSHVSNLDFIKVL